MTNDATADTTATDEQVIDHTEATDAEQVRERLPADVRDRLTKRAFSPGSLRLLLRDTYYMGPIEIGTGGWRGIYGGGMPGTGMRRPQGALYNFPRSWRFAALERALQTGLIVHVGAGMFAATARGVAVLDAVDRCPEHDAPRVPMVRHSYYQGNPFTGAGSQSSHRLTTQCPVCGGNGYGSHGDSTQMSYEEYERKPALVEYAADLIESKPDARVFGVDRPLDADIDDVPDVDEDYVERVLAEHVETFTAPTPREAFGSLTEDGNERPVVTIDTAGDVFQFRGTDDALVVSRTNTEAEIHLSLRDTADGDSLRVHMSRETALDKCAKDGVKAGGRASWNPGESYWSVDANDLPRLVSVLTTENGVGEKFTVTVTPDALAACYHPVPGVDENGVLIGNDHLAPADEDADSEDEPRVETDGGFEWLSADDLEPAA